MNFKEVLTSIFLLFAIVAMFFYFIPIDTTRYNANNGNYNFSTVPQTGSMQFYPNMRFQSDSISYRIIDCPLQKENDMEYAFRVVENLTPLSFYPVINNEEITVTCEQRNRLSGDLFIAGEGGPTNITIAGPFNVITYGEILLIRESNCEKPNVAIHELFHVLGFKHSQNPENIMYAISSCEQTIGQDMIEDINSLYSIPSYPDLALGNVSAIMSGRFLSINFTVMNIGLNDALDSEVNIFSGGNLIKTIPLKPVLLGYQRIISVQNIFVTQLSLADIEVEVNCDFNEINKENNKVTLQIK